MGIHKEFNPRGNFRVLTLSDFSLVIVWRGALTKPSGGLNYRVPSEK